MSAIFEDDTKWMILKQGKDSWVVLPPTGSFWGESYQASSGEEALEEFRRQTFHTTYKKPALVTIEHIFI